MRQSSWIRLDSRFCRTTTLLLTSLGCGLFHKQAFVLPLWQIHLQIVLRGSIWQPIVLFGLQAVYPLLLPILRLLAALRNRLNGQLDLTVAEFLRIDRFSFVV